MWRGHLGALLDYQRAICNEWTSRGYKDTCLTKSMLIVADLISAGLAQTPNNDEFAEPKWLGNPELHRSHRSNLLRKMPEHYVSFFEADLPDNLEYVWPVL